MILSYLKREFKKPTPFLLLIIFGLGLFAYIFYSMLPYQKVGLVVGKALITFLVLAFILLIDRVIVRKYKLSTIVLIELCIVSIIWLYVSWSIKAATLIVKTKQDHFTVVFMEGGSKLDDLGYTNIFKKELSIEGESCILLDKSLISLDVLEIKPHIWQNYSKESEDIYINGATRTVNRYWTGTEDFDSSKFKPCLNSLKPFPILHP